MNDLYSHLAVPADIDADSDLTRSRAIPPNFELKPRTPKWLERPGNPLSVDSDGAGYPESEDWGAP